MTEPITITLSEQQVSMLANAQAAYNSAAKHYESLIGVLIAGADAPAGSPYRLNLRERTITVSPPEQSA